MTDSDYMADKDDESTINVNILRRYTDAMINTDDEPTTDVNILRRRADAAINLHLTSQAETISALRLELATFRTEYIQEMRAIRKEIDIQQEVTQPLLAWVTNRMEHQKRIERAAEKGILAAIGVIVAGITAFVIDIIRKRLQ